MRRSWIVVGLTLATTIALGIGSAGAASAKGLILRQYEGGPVVSDGATSILFMEIFVYGRECRYILDATLLHNTRATDGLERKSATTECTTGLSTSGTPATIGFSDRGKLSAKAGPKLAFDVLPVCKVGGGCSPNCIFETAKLAGTFSLPGLISFRLAGTLKRNAKASEPGCAKTATYEGQGWLEGKSPKTQVYYGEVGSL